MAGIEALRAVYEDYADAYRQRVIENGALHGLHKFLLGNSTQSDRKADMAFYRQVEQAVAALPEDGETAEDALRLMLLEARGADSTSQLMVEAAQPLAMPLIPRASREGCAAILAVYTARYPRRRMLAPRQRELLAALEDHISK